MGEIERTLLHITAARERAERTLREFERAEVDQHLVEAVRQAEEELREVHRRLMQRSFFAVPAQQDQLAV